MTKRDRLSALQCLVVAIFVVLMMAASVGLVWLTFWLVGPWAIPLWVVLLVWGVIFSLAGNHRWSEVFDA